MKCKPIKEFFEIQFPFYSKLKTNTKKKNKIKMQKIMKTEEEKKNNKNRTIYERSNKTTDKIQLYRIVSLVMYSERQKKLYAVNLTFTI